MKKYDSAKFSDDLLNVVFYLNIKEMADHLWWLEFWIKKCPQASLGEAAKKYQHWESNASWWQKAFL